MAHADQNKDEPRKILAHEPVPGYRTAFWIIFALSLFYLAIVFSNGAH
ncbi:hypothetical protein [Geoalkalibacter subterraneus]|nr:hypothetical protein [Geoalkalibacter subterraneus]